MNEASVATEVRNRVLLRGITFGAQRTSTLRPTLSQRRSPASRSAENSAVFAAASTGAEHQRDSEWLPHRLRASHVKSLAVRASARGVECCPCARSLDASAAPGNCRGPRTNSTEPWQHQLRQPRWLARNAAKSGYALLRLRCLKFSATERARGASGRRRWIGRLVDTKIYGRRTPSRASATGLLDVA